MLQKINQSNRKIDKNSKKILQNHDTRNQNEKREYQKGIKTIKNLLKQNEMFHKN